MTTTARLTDAQAAYLEALFREYHAQVLRMAFAQLRDEDAAEDLAQNVWLAIIPRLARGEDIEPRPHAYLAATVRTRAINYRTRGARRERAADWSDAVTSRMLPSAAPADVDALAAGELTAHQAAVLKLTAQGVSQRAIAHRLGRAQSTVSYTLHRGAARLRALAA